MDTKTKGKRLKGLCFGSFRRRRKKQIKLGRLIDTATQVLIEDTSSACLHGGVKIKSCYTNKLAQSERLYTWHEGNIVPAGRRSEEPRP
jgi:hypothetical protein